MLETSGLRLANSLGEVILFSWDASKLLKLGAGVLTAALSASGTSSPRVAVAEHIVLVGCRRLASHGRFLRLRSVIFALSICNSCDCPGCLLDDKDAGLIVVHDDICCRLERQSLLLRLNLLLPGIV